MATYIPNPTDPAEPQVDKPAASAAAEFRALKQYIQETILASIAAKAPLASTATHTADVVLWAASNAPSSQYSAGYRGLAPETKNETFTLLNVHSGRDIIKNNSTAYTWTIAPDGTGAWRGGDVIVLTNDGSSGNVTVARGSGVALLNSSGTNANRTVAPNRTAVIRRVGVNRWRITGEYS